MGFSVTAETQTANDPVFTSLVNRAQAFSRLWLVITSDAFNWVLGVGFPRCAKVIVVSLDQCDNGHSWEQGNLKLAN